MNTDRPTASGTDQYRSLQILDELSNNDSLTQRDLSSRLGIALGLVNSYIKNLIKKGYITIKTIPTKRYAYYLTPKGFAEKTRLTYHMLQDYTRIYREAKNNYRKLFQELEQSGVKRVIFAGADEVAEFAYLTLQDTRLELAGVLDDEKTGQKFFGILIRNLNAAKDLQYDVIVIASYLKREEIHKRLTKGGVKKGSIRQVFPAIG